MSEQVTLSVSSDLKKVLADLEGLQKKAAAVGQQVQRVATELDKNLAKNTKVTEQHFERLRDLGRRLADQLRGYFSNIATQTSQSLEKVKANLGLKQQFIDATKGAIELHDVLRKIGATLGIAGERMTSFQQAATEAFSQRGFGSSVAARAMQGVAQTQVRGESNMLEYGTTAAMLGNAGGQTDATGEIAKGLAGVIQARGGNVNDTKAMAQLADDVRKVLNATGEKPLEVLTRMEGLYRGFASDKRQQIGSGGMRNLSAVGAVVGPEFDQLVRELSEGRLKRLPKDAQGLGKLIGKDGVDFKALDKLAGIGKRIGFDNVASFQTAGLSEGAAQGMVRLLEQRDAAKAAQAKANGMGGSLEQQSIESRGIMENGSAIKERVGGHIQGVLAPAVGATSNLLSKASQSDVGSFAAMGGGFLAAAAGVGGLSMLAKKLGGKGGIGAAASSMAKASALEQITGQKTIPVYVVNVAEFAGLGGGTGGGGTQGMAGAASKLSKAAEGLLGLSTALSVGLALGTAAEGLIDKHTQGTTKDGHYKGNAAERVFYEFFKGIQPIMQMLPKAIKEGMGLDDIGKMLQRNSEEAKRQAQTTPPSKARRGTAAAATNDE